MYVQEHKQMHKFWRIVQTQQDYVDVSAAPPSSQL